MTGRQPVTVTDEADKMANAFIGAVPTNWPARSTPTWAASKTGNGRDTIRTAVEE